MLHRISTPPPAVSEQLHPSMAVVCIEPVVTPSDTALTSASCTLAYVTAANPSAGSTGKGHRWTRTSRSLAPA